MNEHLVTNEEIEINSRPFMFIRLSGKIVRIDIKNTFLIESCKDYVKIHKKETEKSQSCIVHIMHGCLKQTLERFEERFGKVFIRVHRQYAVQWSLIKEIENNLIYIRGKEVPIGREYKQGLEKALFSV